MRRVITVKNDGRTAYARVVSTPGGTLFESRDFFIFRFSDRPQLQVAGPFSDGALVVQEPGAPWTEGLISEFVNPYFGLPRGTRS